MSLDIIARENWLDFAPRYRTPASHAGKPAVDHYFGPGTPAESLEGGIEQCRRFADYHVNRLGWADYAYNWTILREGTVLEGRGRDVRGAHAGNNTANGYAGILILIGTGNLVPTGAQLISLQRLAARERLTRFTGHQEWSPTLCPGAPHMDWIRANRAPKLTPDPQTYPHGNTLRVVVNGRSWSGNSSDWGKALYALRAIAKRGLKLEAKAAIAWKGGVWRKSPGEHAGPIVNVARTLLNRYDGGWQ